MHTAGCCVSLARPATCRSVAVPTVAVPGGRGRDGGRRHRGQRRCVHLPLRVRWGTPRKCRTSPVCWWSAACPTTLAWHCSRASRDAAGGETNGWQPDAVLSGRGHGGKHPLARYWITSSGVSGRQTGPRLLAGHGPRAGWLVAYQPTNPTWQVGSIAMPCVVARPVATTRAVSRIASTLGNRAAAHSCQLMYY